MRRGIAAVAAVSLAGTVAACGGTSSSPGATTVHIKTFEFTPHRVTVDAGTTVTFVNDDAILHTATSGTRKGDSNDTPDGRFDIKLDGAGSTGSYDFRTAGTYRYFCKIHPGPGMTGEIDVR